MIMDLIDFVSRGIMGHTELRALMPYMNRQRRPAWVKLLTAKKIPSFRLGIFAMRVSLTTLSEEQNCLLLCIKPDGLEQRVLNCITFALLLSV